MASHRIKIELSFVMHEMDDENAEASAEIADMVLREVLNERTAWDIEDVEITSAEDA